MALLLLSQLHRRGNQDTERLRTPFKATQLQVTWALHTDSGLQTPLLPFHCCLLFTRPTCPATGLVPGQGLVLG